MTSKTEANIGDSATTLPRQKIDIQMLENYLDNVKSIAEWFSKPLVLSQFSHGQSNPTYLITCNGGSGKNFVLRKQPPGDIISKTAHRIDREYRVMKALASTDVPVPEVYHLCMDESIVGKPFYIMEYMQGRIFKDVKLTELSPEDRAACWIDCVRTMAKIHNVDYKAIGLETFGKTSGYYTRQIKTLGQVASLQLAVDEKKVPRIPYFEQLRDRLVADQPSETTSIVHGDYKMDNMIFHPTENRVIAVIDWEMSTLGAFGADLGNCFSSFFVPTNFSDTEDLTIGAALLNAISHDDAKRLGIPSREELIKCYCDTRQPPIDYREQMRLVWYYMCFYWWKTAIVLQGITARSIRGQASSAFAELVGKGTPEMGKLSKFALTQLDKESRSNL